MDENGEFWWIVAAAVVGGAIAGTIGGATSGFILGGGNALMAGGSFGDAYLNAMTGMFTGAVTGAVIGGIGGGALSYFKGENVWNGNAIAQGRNAFSLKNTPIDAIEHPNTISFDNIPDVALLDDPLLNNMNGTQMSPYEKGQLGVREAMREFIEDGGQVYQTEVTIDVPHTLSNGTTKMVSNRFDFVGQKDGLLHLFEVKNGPSARFTPNQKINLPKLMMNHSQFIPRGFNASRVPQFKPIIGKPYIGNYVVVYKHYF